MNHIDVLSFLFLQIPDTGMFNAPPLIEAKLNSASPIGDYEQFLAVLTFGFTIVVLIILAIVIKVAKIPPDLSVKLVLITLIITTIMFLITTAFDQDQMTPAIGLLGTIAGYLLGKDASK